MRSCKEIQDAGGVSMSALIFEAFNTGLAEGRREGEALRANLLGILGMASEAVGSQGQHQEHGSFSDSLDAEVARVAPGTVKPGIVNVIRRSGGGMTTEEIIAATGFKPNSVRGTLSALKSGQAIDKSGNRWILSGALRLGIGEST